MTDTTLTSRLHAITTAGSFGQSTVDQFARFIATAPEDELFRASPLRYASQHRIPEREAIDLFLHATHAGILDFSWGVLCPMCVSFLTTAGGLRSLRDNKRCTFCQIDVRSEMDDNIEVAFTVAPSVRRIRFHDPGSLDMRGDGLRLFFSTSVPSDGIFHRTLGREVIEAGRIGTGEEHELAVRLESGRYVIVAPASHGVLHFEAMSGASDHGSAVDLLDGCWVPDHFHLASGEISLRIRNQTKHAEGYLLLPDPVPSPKNRPTDMVVPEQHLQPFLTGKRLISTQAFRELFRAESIPSEGGLELKNLTVLFTDLKGSTEMYERIGDLRAYDLVRQHFARLREVSIAQGGSIVKTIGDAIMATFPESEPGLQAAITMNREIRKVGRGEDLQLKIGLHTGPCIAVELNERLDYFGRTVNIAARVQGLANASEIVVTDAVYHAAGAKRIIAEAGLKTDPAEVSLKGIAGNMPVYRLH